MKMQPIDLPPPKWPEDSPYYPSCDAYSADQMHAYAAQAVADMRCALHEADRLAGHDDAFTEWREKWAHLWA